MNTIKENNIELTIGKSICLNPQEIDVEKRTYLLISQ
jgi:hypothetical protein